MKYQFKGDEGTLIRGKTTGEQCKSHSVSGHRKEAFTYSFSTDNSDLFCPLNQSPGKGLITDRATPAFPLKQSSKYAITASKDPRRLSIFWLWLRHWTAVRVRTALLIWMLILCTRAPCASAPTRCRSFNKKLQYFLFSSSLHWQFSPSKPPLPPLTVLRLAGPGEPLGGSQGGLCVDSQSVAGKLDDTYKSLPFKLII